MKKTFLMGLLCLSSLMSTTILADAPVVQAQPEQPAPNVQSNVQMQPTANSQTQPTPNVQMQNQDFTQYNFPDSCEAIGYEYLGNYLLLKTTKIDRPQLYLLYNESNYKILIDHARGRDSGASAGWASEIEPGHWSTMFLAAQPQAFQISCQIVQEGSRYPIANCSTAIKVCQFQNYQLTNPKMAQGGSYWVSENKLLNDTLDTMGRRGFLVTQKK